MAHRAFGIITQSSPDCGRTTTKRCEFNELANHSEMLKFMRSKQFRWSDLLGHMYITYFLIDYSEDIFLYTFQ